MASQLAVTAAEWWADTSVDIPAELDSPRWRSLISDADVAGGTGTFRVAELLVASERRGRKLGSPCRTTGLIGDVVARNSQLIPFSSISSPSRSEHPRSGDANNVHRRPRLARPDEFCSVQ
jgi:hypothetical protein